jgi:hypothetical protein
LDLDTCLEQVLQIGDSNTAITMDDITVIRKIAEGDSGSNIQRELDLAQEITWNDYPGQYRITITFTASVADI